MKDCFFDSTLTPVQRKDRLLNILSLIESKHKNAAFYKSVFEQYKHYAYYYEQTRNLLPDNFEREITAEILGHYFFYTELENKPGAQNALRKIAIEEKEFVDEQVLSAIASAALPRLAAVEGREIKKNFLNTQLEGTLRVPLPANTNFDEAIILICKRLGIKSPGYRREPGFETFQQTLEGILALALGKSLTVVLRPDKGTTWSMIKRDGTLLYKAVTVESYELKEQRRDQKFDWAVQDGQTMARMGIDVQRDMKIVQQAAQKILNEVSYWFEGEVFIYFAKNEFNIHYSPVSKHEEKWPMGDQIEPLGLILNEIMRSSQGRKVYVYGGACNKEKHPDDNDDEIVTIPVPELDPDDIEAEIDAMINERQAYAERLRQVAAEAGQELAFVAEILNPADISNLVSARMALALLVVGTGRDMLSQ